LHKETQIAFADPRRRPKIFQAQGSAQPFEKARFGQGNQRKSKGFFVAETDKSGAGRADSGFEKGSSRRRLAKGGTRPMPAFREGFSLGADRDVASGRFTEPARAR
jgi:hypothetical protein